MNRSLALLVIASVLGSQDDGRRGELPASAEKGQGSDTPIVALVVPKDRGTVSSIAPIRILGTAALGRAGGGIRRVTVRFVSSDGSFDSGEVPADLRED